MKKSSQVYIAYFWVHSLACLLYLYVQKEGMTVNEELLVRHGQSLRAILLHADTTELFT